MAKALRVASRMGTCCMVNVHKQGYSRSEASTLPSLELSDIIERLLADKPDLLEDLRPRINDHTASPILTEIYKAWRVKRVLESFILGLSRVQCDLKMS